MRQLSTTDKCYKFFYSEQEAVHRAGSQVYETGQTYISKNYLYFFRRDEAISSLKMLLYFMGYGDSLAELVVDEELVSNTVESSPEHFAATKIMIRTVYDNISLELRELVVEALRECRDFTIVKFGDVLIRLIEIKAFDTALYVYETICEEKNLQLSREDILPIMELGRQPWCCQIPLKEVYKCENMKEYIKFMKKAIYFEDYIG